jgi:fused signal recognition particle receptor
MFNWFRRSKEENKQPQNLSESPVEVTQESESSPTPTQVDPDLMWSVKVLADQGLKREEMATEELDWLQRLRQGLGKSRRELANQLKGIVGQGPLTQKAIADIETLLLQADVGVEATDYIISKLETQVREKSLASDEAFDYLKTLLCEILERPLKYTNKKEFAPDQNRLNIWLMTGVNGAGKTTTIGKLANLANKSGYNSIIVAADTFRAAAVQQVKVWGERSNTPVIANPGENTDPAAVVFDGINAALAKNINLLLIDTAGRLQNKKNLMEELAKIRRIIDKKAPDAKVESLLVLDATLGQNGLRQAQVFAETAKLTGVVLTKLDGTAKGGVAFGVAQQLDLPIRFVGAGEGIEDLRPFSSYEFVEALLS